MKYDVEHALACKLCCQPPSQDFAQAHVPPQPCNNVKTRAHFVGLLFPVCTKEKPETASPCVMDSSIPVRTAYTSALCLRGNGVLLLRRDCVRSVFLVANQVAKRTKNLQQTRKGESVIDDNGNHGAGIGNWVLSHHS